MSRILRTHGKDYQLDTRDVNLVGVAMAQTVWIVKIEDENGHYITSTRCAGEQDEVTKIASQWLNSLCRHNPGKLLRHVVTMHIDRD